MHKDIAIEHFGNQAAIAKALGISQTAVSKWPDIIPELRAYQIQSLTAGRLFAEPSHYDRPDTVEAE